MSGVDQFNVTYTETGYIQMPKKVNNAVISVVGGGGGGGGSALSTMNLWFQQIYITNGGGGGGSGAVTTYNYTRTNIDTNRNVSWTIGAGGTGGTGRNALDTYGDDGNRGGTTILRVNGTEVQRAVGGNGGGGAASSASTQNSEQGFGGDGGSPNGGAGSWGNNGGGGGAGGKNSTGYGSGGAGGSSGTYSNQYANGGASGNSGAVIINGKCNYYKITVASNNANYGTVTVTSGTARDSSGNYYTGVNVKLTATPATGYQISSWTRTANGTTTNIQQGGTTYSFEPSMDATYTVVFTPIIYTVTFVPNGGSITNPSNGWVLGNTTCYKDFAYGTSATTITSDFTASCTLNRTGYSRTDWTYGDKFVNNVLTGNTTVDAVWTVNTYTINYIGNGTTRDPVNTSSLTNTFRYDTTFTLPTPTRIMNGTQSQQNYNFLGWSVNSDGTGKITEITENTTPRNITLYANWGAKKYKLRYYKRTNPSNFNLYDEVDYTYDVEYTLASVSRTYCTFKAWHSGSLSGNTITKLAKGTFGQQNVYAEWVGKTYTLNLTYGNLSYGGTINTGLPSGKTSVELQYNPDISNPTTVLTFPTASTSSNAKEDFYGWYESSDFTGDRYAGQNNKYSIASFGNQTEKTFYARWVTCRIKVTANKNGVTTDQVFSKLENIGKPGGTAPITLWTATPTSETYDFSYWSQSSNGTGTHYAPGANYAPTLPTDLVPQSDNEMKYNVTLYAQWNQAYRVEITYNANGGSWVGDPPAASYRSIYSDMHDRDIRAVFNPLPTHNPIGTLPVTFQGWDHDQTKTGTGEYNSASTSQITVPDSTRGYVYDANRLMKITLYAVWPSVKSVTFKANISTLPITWDAKITYGDTTVTDNLPVETNSVGLLDVLPTADLAGYFFNGWWLTVSSESDPSKKVQANSTYFADDTDVYAHWIHQHHITFSGNGIPFESTSYVTNAEQKLDAIPPLPESEDYFIIGWYTTPYEGGEEVDTDYIFNADTVVYARWKAIFRITFDPAGGDVSPRSLRTNSDYKIPLNDFPVPKRSGYTLNRGAGGTGTGWWDMDNTMLQVDGDTIFTKHVTLYARWVPVATSVLFDTNVEDGETAYIIEDNQQYVTLTWTPVTFGMSYLYVGPNQANRPAFPLGVRDGYSFAGWSLQGGANNTPNVFTDTLFEDMSHRVLYAVWVESGKEVIFDPVGGTVAPAKTLTNKDGMIQFYPTPTRTGYRFLGWYNWPMYSSAYDLQSDDIDQTAVNEAYHSVSGTAGDTKPPNRTLLQNLFNGMLTQFQFDETLGTDGLWVDATGITFLTFYFSTDEIMVIDSDGQCAALNGMWSMSTSNNGWTLDTSGAALTVTYTPDPSTGRDYFENPQELYNKTNVDVPNNGDVAEIRQGLERDYCIFNILNGVNIVLSRSNGTNAVYMWCADETSDYGGVWEDTTDDWSTIILLDHKFTQDSTRVYAHWSVIPEPETYSNVCYIERRLSKDTDDTIRMYLPVITSIEDTISASLVQKDTMMFGYENKFVTDMGTSQRFAVSVQRVNPVPYDDRSYDPADWSNGKWFNEFIRFTNYWQNFGRDITTGSMVGGFRFHFIPKNSSENDDRVDYGELYPILNKNVFLTGNIEADLGSTVLKFTMNLAVGQMTSDVKTTGYQIGLKYSNVSTVATWRFIPDGIDFVLPSKPPEWTAPEGYMFLQWTVIGGASYKPGDVIPYNEARDLKSDDQRNPMIYAEWVQTNAALCMIQNFIDPSTGEYIDDAFGEGLVYDTVGSFDDVFRCVNRSKEETYDGSKYTTIEFEALQDITLSLVLVGGGGGGAGGVEEPETFEVDTGLGGLNDFIRGIGDVLGTAAKGIATALHLTSGGAGGAGKVETVTVQMYEGDRISCWVGKGGGVRRNDGWDVSEPYHFLEGQTGGATFVLYHPRTGGELTYYAPGGLGGSRNGAGGADWQRGGNGGSRTSAQSHGATAISGQQGIPGDPKGDTDNKGSNINNLTPGLRTYWHGGGGGGASALRESVKVGNEWLSFGTNMGDDDKRYYVSVGGNGAGNGNNAPAQYTEGGAYYGGGGGSGCAGCSYLVSDGGVGISFRWNTVNYQNPTGGANGLLLMKVNKR